MMLLPWDTETEIARAIHDNAVSYTTHGTHEYLGAELLDLPQSSNMHRLKSADGFGFVSLECCHMLELSNIRCNGPWGFVFACCCIHRQDGRLHIVPRLLSRLVQLYVTYMPWSRAIQEREP
ncbi:hypothetical protein M8818_003538 [Zalaria obscura]|uniref:Uncharacterized protein n=1 Tax=Zalaria obscura TaxID=2024903 RepID=A0ACC3SEZ3_9PEZI